MLLANSNTDTFKDTHQIYSRKILQRVRKYETPVRLQQSPNTKCILWALLFTVNEVHIQKAPQEV